jgi:hypothetical protein
MMGAWLRAVRRRQWRESGSESGSVERWFTSWERRDGLGSAIGGLGTGAPGPDSGHASWGLLRGTEATAALVLSMQGRR